MPGIVVAESYRRTESDLESTTKLRLAKADTLG